MLREEYYLIVTKSENSNIKEKKQKVRKKQIFITNDYFKNEIS